MITIEIPGVLREYANGDSAITLEDSYKTVGEALGALRDRAPGVFERVTDERGEVRAHVNVFVGEESIRWSDGLRTPVAPGERISILAAVSGG